jgi:hypothetical protein
MLRGTVGARSIRTWPVRTHCIQPTTVHTRLMSTGPVWILLASHCTSKRNNSAAQANKAKTGALWGNPKSLQNLGKNCPNAVWLRFRLLTWGNVMLRGWRGALVCQSRFCHQLGRRLFCRLHTTHHVRDDCISFGRLWQHCLQQSCAWSNRCHIWWRPLSSCGWSIRASVWRQSPYGKTEDGSGRSHPVRVFFCSIIVGGWLAWRRLSSEAESWK